ncbi:MAG: hypothetical protein GY751_13895 [Bacteroidetes bacterium]|nr:hypothetical protein [Bacteroidota bacterium]
MATIQYTTTDRQVSKRDTPSSITMQRYMRISNQEEASNITVSAILSFAENAISLNNIEEFKYALSLIPFAQMNHQLISRLIYMFMNMITRRTANMTPYIKELSEAVFTARSQQSFEGSPIDRHIEILSSEHITDNFALEYWSTQVLIKKFNDNIDRESNYQSFTRVIQALMRYSSNSFDINKLLYKLELIRQTYYPKYDFEELYQQVQQDYNDDKYRNNNNMDSSEDTRPIHAIDYIVEGYRKYSKSVNSQSWVKTGNPITPQQLYGPSNPTFDGTNHFMLAKRHEWFRGYCMTCDRRILSHYDCARRPQFGGGWSGCYCSWSCIIAENENLNDPLITNLIRHFDAELRKVPILIPKK